MSLPTVERTVGFAGALFVVVACIDATEEQIVVPYGRTVYPMNQTLSPMTPMVIARMRSITAFGRGKPRNENQYIRVGDSQTNNSFYMRSFGLTPDTYDLGEHPELQATVDYYINHVFFGPACLSTTRSAWVLGLEGLDQIPLIPPANPSPLTMDLDGLTDPFARIGSKGRFAVVMYGTNYEPPSIWEPNMREIVRQCIAQGTIPILTTIPTLALLGSPGLAEELNSILRVIAEDNLVPFVDLYRELALLPNQGLSPDDKHLSAVNTLGDPIDDGFDLTPAGLAGGFNTRNLLTLQMLARTRAALVDGTEAP